MPSIRVSIGTAGVLGLAQVPMAVAPTTAYLMLGERCVMNCAFCAQARHSVADDSALSRVTWPAFPLREVCDRLHAAERQKRLRRVCIQVTAGQKSYHLVLGAIQQIKQATQLPIDAAILPAHIGQVSELFAAGLDHVGFGLDAACERIFRTTKGQHWQHRLDLIAEAATRFPGHIAIHLIVGLGESEKEMVERVVWAHTLGIEVGLFAFTPVRGTPLADRSQPPLAQYRRMQAARWLVVNHGAHMKAFVFDERGTLTAIRLAGWPALLADGSAFRTSGCPDCNRPFYNERPGGTTYNYARPLSFEQGRQAIHEMKLIDLDLDARYER
ncbi:MAG: radical SAM protein [Anaerolineae bacterium]|nr:radical SAM protein [Anaerolineae bacterium]